jgi:transposase
LGEPLFARKPSEEEGRRLRSVSLSKDFTKRTRASVVLESSNGLVVSEIADKLHLNKHTVRLWIKRFDDEGMPGLESKPIPRRPPSITEEQKDSIVRIALSSPRELGMNFTTWSLSSLKSYLERKGVVSSISLFWIWSILVKKGLDTSRAGAGR